MSRFGTGHENHDDRCARSKAKRCRCSCGGELHGRDAVGVVVSSEELTAICHWCRDPLTYVTDFGWTHAGGGIYIQVCNEKRGGCGWTGSRDSRGLEHRAYWTCPTCERWEPMEDDHCALPTFVAMAVGVA